MVHEHFGNREGFNKAFPFYGIPAGIEIMDLSITNTKVFGYFGQNDHSIGFSDPQSATRVAALFQKAGKSFKLTIVKAGHAFMNRDRAETYIKEVADMVFAEVIKEIK